MPDPIPIMVLMTAISEVYSLIWSDRVLKESPLLPKTALKLWGRWIKQCPPTQTVADTGHMGNDKQWNAIATKQLGCNQTQWERKRSCLHNMVTPRPLHWGLLGLRFGWLVGFAFVFLLFFLLLILFTVCLHISLALLNWHAPYVPTVQLGQETMKWDTTAFLKPKSFGGGTVPFP